MTTPPSPPTAVSSDTPTRRAHRRFARTVGAGLGLIAVLTLLWPLFSYRSDVVETRRQVRERLSSQANLIAEFIALHEGLMQDELERVAGRPEVNFRDNTTAPEERLLQLAHQGSILFRKGVALLDVHGRVVWSEPASLLANVKGIPSTPWFQSVLVHRKPVLDLLSLKPPTWVVAVPVRKEGVAVGLSDPEDWLLSGTRPEGETLWIVSPRGELVSTGSEARPELAAQVQEFIDRHPLSGTTMEQRIGDRDIFAAESAVEGTGFHVLLIADAEAALAPARGRLLRQLGFLAFLQLFSVVLCSVFLRRTYSSFTAIETRAAQSEKMAALGSASSLIAHEVKNSLNGLGAVATTLERERVSAELVRVLRGQTDRLKHLAQSLLDFGRPMAPRMQPVSLGNVARETVSGLRVLPEAEDVDVQLEASDDITVQADPLLLLTALDNLVRNAMEAGAAAKDVGRVEAPWVRIRSRHEGSVAAVEVEDNAGGPPASFEDGQFQPFQTSKPKGIGLGLAMARRAVEGMGGALVFRRTDAGSLFTVSLRTDVEPEAAASGGSEP